MIERCRRCDRIFQTAWAAGRHEASCPLRHGDPRVLQRRHCGKGFGFRYGRLRRWAHERHCRGSLEANLTCCVCSVVFGSSLARRLHERVCGGIRPEEGGEVFFRCSCGFEVLLQPGAPVCARNVAANKTLRASSTSWWQ